MLLRFTMVLLAVLAVDWGLGVAATAGILPYWAFLLANIPFGALYWWLEAHWEGTRYVVNGQTVAEGWANAAFAFVVLARSVKRPRFSRER